MVKVKIYIFVNYRFMVPNHVVIYNYINLSVLFCNYHRTEGISTSSYKILLKMKIVLCHSSFVGWQVDIYNVIKTLYFYVRLECHMPISHLNTTYWSIWSFELITLLLDVRIYQKQLICSFQLSNPTGIEPATS